MHVGVDIDFRTFVSSLRYRIKDVAIKSVTEPGVKTAIYEDIYYELLSGEVPIDTGALDVSPSLYGAIEYIGQGETDKRPHYAQGDINDTGIWYDPYSVSTRTGLETHYAGYVLRGIDHPNHLIKSNYKTVEEIVKEHIVDAMQEEWDG